MTRKRMSGRPDGGIEDDSWMGGRETDCAQRLLGWAKAYREGPAEYRFPSDPNCEFFPQDLERAAAEILRLRSAPPVTGEKK